MKKLYIVLLAVAMLAALCPATAQTWTWARSSAGPKYQFEQCHATDKWGNNFLVGYTECNPGDTGNTISFGPCSLTGTEIYYSYLTKYSPSGSPLWAKKLNNVNNLFVTTDSSGNVYVTGMFNTSVTFGTHTVYAVDSTNSANFNVFVAGFDANGNPQWLRSAGGPGASRNYPTGITTDNAGNVIVIGTLDNTITFGSTTLSNHPSVYADQFDGFVAKYDASGNVQWAKHMEGNEDDEPMGVATDPDGNVIVAGTFTSDTLGVGSTEIVRSGGAYQMMLVKFAPNGSLSWVRVSAAPTSAEGAVVVRAKAVTCDDADNIYITGSTNAYNTDFGAVSLNIPNGWGQFLIAKYTAAGTCAWAKVTAFTTSCGSAIGLGIAAFKSQYLYAIGLTGSHYVTPFGAVSIDPFSSFLIKFDTAGTMLICDNHPTGNWVTLTADKAGNAYLSGNLGGDYTFGSNVLHNTGASNAFIAKFGNASLPSEGIKYTRPARLMSVYPNPATNVLFLETAGEIGPVTIYNTMGSAVRTGNYSTATASIDIATLPPGVYYIRLNGGETATFVKN